MSIRRLNTGISWAWFCVGLNATAVIDGLSKRNWWGVSWAAAVAVVVATLAAHWQRERLEKLCQIIADITQPSLPTSEEAWEALRGNLDAERGAWLTKDIHP